MCVVSKPKIPKGDEAKPKDPAIIRNPYLDGVDPVMKALRTGRSALRIERTGAGGVPTPSPVPAPTGPSLPNPDSGLPYIGGRRGGRRGGALVNNF